MSRSVFGVRRGVSEPPVDTGRHDDCVVRLWGRWVAAFTRARRMRAPHALSGQPVLGSLLEFRDRRLELLERAAGLGEIVALRLGAMPAVLISSPELAHELLASHHDDAVQAPTLRIVGEPLIGRGVLTADGRLGPSPSLTSLEIRR